MDNEVVIIEMDLFKWESIKEYLQLTPEIDYKLIKTNEKNEQHISDIRRVFKPS